MNQFINKYIKKSTRYVVPNSVQTRMSLTENWRPKLLIRHITQIICQRIPDLRGCDTVSTSAQSSDDGVYPSSLACIVLLLFYTGAHLM